MRLIFVGVLALGMMLAGGAVMMLKYYMSSQQSAFAAQIQARGAAIPLTPVMVAARSLPYGEELRPQDMLKIDWPSAALPPGAFAKMTNIFPKSGEQRIVTRAMERGEPILRVKVTEPGADAGIRSQLQRGMRAFAITVNVQTGASGFLRPGDSVDVYWTGSVPSTTGTRGANITRLIDRSLNIIAVDQRADTEANDTNIARTTTVEISPQQVAALAERTIYVLGKALGRTTLTLLGLDGRYETERVSNLMVVGGNQQIMLKVRFAEMQRSVRKSLSSSLVLGQSGRFRQAAASFPIPTIWRLASMAAQSRTTAPASSVSRLAAGPCNWA